MTNDIDLMLRDLEKQVQDFTLNMAEHQSDPSSSAERRYRQHQPPDNRTSSTDDVPLQHYKTRAMPLQQLESNDDSRDDNISIGRILQRSATARRPTNEKPLVQLSQSKSLRSTSTSTGLSRRKRDQVAPPLPTPEDEELRFAMQRAWAVLDSDTQESKEAASTAPTTAPSEDYKSSNMVSTGRIQTVPLKTLTTRIYIDDANNHKVVQLSNLLTTAMVVQYLKKKGLLDHSDDWSLFEIDNQHGVERPLREWEIVLDVLSVWEPDASNALLVKKYSYHYTLTSESILQKKIPPMHGWLSIEYKKGKWQKRYCFIKDNAIHHSKDNKGSSSSILCHLATYDVYTLLQPIRISPSPFVFAIRAQDRSSIFEKESDYMRFLAVEDQEDMKDWVLSIRCTKSNIHYQYHPNRVANPLAHISLESTLDDSQQPTTTANHTTVRRHKSTRDLKSDDHTKHAAITAPPSVPSLPRSESTRRIEQEGAKRALGRSGTTRGGAGHTRNPTTTAKNNADIENSTTTSTTATADGPLIDCLGPPTFAKGSLLAKEEEAEQIQYRQQQQQLQQQQELMQRQQTQQQQQQQQHEEPSTLIQIDDSIKFAKGSLLDQKENGNVKMTRSKSVREVSSNHNSEESSSHRRHVSLRRKPTGGKRLQHHDVPLPNNAAIASLPISPPPAIPPSTASSMLNSNHNQNHTTLLQLNNNQERSHTRELHARHGKPLLNFDSPNTTSTTTRK